MLSVKKHPVYVLIIIAVDVLSIASGALAAYAVRFSGFLIPIHKGIPSFETYLRTVCIVVPLYILIFRAYRLYQSERHIRRIQELINVVKAISMGTLILMALTFIYREFSYSRLVLLFAWAFSIIFCCASRYLLIQIEYLIRKKDRDRVLVVGTNQIARDMIRWARENPHYGQEVIGVIRGNHESRGEHIEGIPIVGGLEDLAEIIDTMQIEEIIVADPSISRSVITDLILICENKMIGFKLAADFYGLMTRHLDMEYISNVPLLGLKSPPLADPWNRLLKRFFDLTLSSIFLIALFPIFGIIAVLIKLSDGGPVFYQQERVGRDGKHFKLHKFRTMTVDAERETGPVWSKPNDPRVTALGRFLRSTNLDELPQLWNVFIGNMSLVGPRPERPHFVEQFRDQIPRYMARHKIKSGLTGWAQIRGLRGNTSLEERVKYDLYYMENWTLMMDIEILLATIFAFKNAY